MNKIAIYGAGGFGREMALMIHQINQQKPQWDLVGFFDDGLEKDSVVDGLKVLGGFHELNGQRESLAICMAIAEPSVRSKIVHRINNQFISYPVLVHPMASTGSNKNQFGKGCIITAGVIMTTGIVIGDFSIVNLACTIGHDVTLESYCTIMPGCSVSGNVSIGRSTVMGTGSRIIQGISIGENCIVGAGSVVTKSFTTSKKIMGVPARSV